MGTKWGPNWPCKIEKWGPLEVKKLRLEFVLALTKDFRIY
jgi:hypothetical protein